MSNNLLTYNEVKKLSFNPRIFTAFKSKSWNDVSYIVVSYPKTKGHFSSYLDSAYLPADWQAKNLTPSKNETDLVNRINELTSSGIAKFDLDFIWENNKPLAKRLAHKIDINSWVIADEFLKDKEEERKAKEIQKMKNEIHEKNNIEFFRTFENGKWGDEVLGVKKQKSSSSSKSSKPRMTDAEKLNILKDMF